MDPINATWYVLYAPSPPAPPSIASCHLSLPAPHPLTFLLDTWGKGGKLIKVTKRKDLCSSAAAKGTVLNLSRQHRRTEMKRLARLQAVSMNSKISHTWTWFRKMWKVGRGAGGNSNSYAVFNQKHTWLWVYSAAFFGFFLSCQSSSVLRCPNFCISSSPPWLNKEWDISAATCLPPFQRLCLVGLNIVGVGFLSLSLSPYRLLAVIFVFIEDPFGVLLLPSTARQPINFAGLPCREAPPHPRPLRSTEPYLPVRLLLHLPERRTSPENGTTQQRRDSGSEGCEWSEAGW